VEPLGRMSCATSIGLPSWLMSFTCTGQHMTLVNNRCCRELPSTQGLLKAILSAEGAER
jgi:hypothetical protein